MQYFLFRSSPTRIFRKSLAQFCRLARAMFADGENSVQVLRFKILIEHYENHNKLPCVCSYLYFILCMSSQHLCMRKSFGRCPPILSMTTRKIAYINHKVFFYDGYSEAFLDMQDILDPYNSCLLIGFVDSRHSLHHDRMIGIVVKKA